MPVPSPCVGICVVTANRVCMGCQRTLDEISSWPQASDAWRQQVIERARQRARIATDDPATDDPAPVQSVARAVDGWIR